MRADDHPGIERLSRRFFRRLDFRRKDRCRRRGRAVPPVEALGRVSGTSDSVLSIRGGGEALRHRRDRRQPRSIGERPAEGPLFHIAPAGICVYTGSIKERSQDRGHPKGLRIVLPG